MVAATRNQLTTKQFTQIPRAGMSIPAARRTASNGLFCAPAAEVQVRLAQERPKASPTLGENRLRSSAGALVSITCLSDVASAALPVCCDGCVTAVASTPPVPVAAWSDLA